MAFIGQVLNMDLTIITLIISSVGVFATFVNICVTYYWNKRKLKADLVSQSRIKWLDRVKGYVSTLITNVTLYRSYVGYIKIINKEQSDGIAHNYICGENRLDAKEALDYYVSQLNIILGKIDVSIESIMLDLSKNEGNKAFREAVTSLGVQIQDIDALISHEDLQHNLEKINLTIIKTTNDRLRDIATNYFKNEWEKAKKGE